MGTTVGGASPRGMRWMASMLLATTLACCITTPAIADDAITDEYRAEQTSLVEGEPAGKDQLLASDAGAVPATASCSESSAGGDDSAVHAADEGAAPVSGPVTDGVDGGEASVPADGLDETALAPEEPQDAESSENEDDAPDAEDGGHSELLTEEDEISLPENRFAIETALADGKVVEPKSGKGVDKTNIQLNQSLDKSYQRWTLEAYGEGYYIVNHKSGLVLHVRGGKAADGTNVLLYHKTGSKAQLWLPEQLKSGAWVLRSLLNQRFALEVQGGKKTNGTNLAIATYSGAKRQQFFLRECMVNVPGEERAVQDGAYVLRTSTKGMEAYATKASGTAANAAIRKAAKGNLQRFWLKYVDGYYTIQSTTSGLALEVRLGSPVAGANVRLATPNGSWKQQWVIEPLQDGGYRLVNRAGGLVLALEGNQPTNGANVRGSYQGDSKVQAWSLKAVAPLATGAYMLTDAATGKRLAASDGGTTAGTALKFATKRNSMPQRFYLKASGSTGVEIVGIQSGLWTAADGGNVKLSKDRYLWSYEWGGKGLSLRGEDGLLVLAGSAAKTDSTANEGISLNAASTTLLVPGYYSLQSLLGTRMAVDGASRSTANVSARSKSTSQAQLWYVSSLGGERYLFTNVRSGFVLETNGANVRQGRYASAKTQIWKASWDSGHNALQFTNLSTGKALSVAGNSAKSGANLRTYAASKAKGQSWRLVTRKAPPLTTLQKRLINAAKKTPTTPPGFCAGWITNVFRNAGLGSWYGNACDHYWKWCHDYNRAALQPGMIISVASHGHTWAGGIWGHIAVYVGNGLVYDCVGFVRTMKADEWISYYGNRMKVKWGWIGNKALN